MSTSELVNLLAILVGPVIAVLISICLENRRRSRDQRLIVLRMLLSTRHVPADPAFSLAINLIPVEFASSQPVISAYREFITSVNVGSLNPQDVPALQSAATKISRLIFEVSRSLNFDIRESDIQHAGYAASGWIERDSILIESQKAMVRTANALWLQLKIAAGVELSEFDRRALGLVEVSSSERKPDGDDNYV